MVRVQYELSRSDTLAVYRLSFTPWQRWRQRAVLAAFAAICLGVATFAQRAPPSERAGGWWVLPVVFVITVLACWVEWWWRQEKASRRARAIGTIIAEFSDAGIAVEIGAARTFFEWRAFTHYRETPTLMLIYQGKTPSNTCPNRR
jgi:hypothetical protein